MLSATACATPPVPQTAAPPPGQARIWFYRLWNPSESLNVANIDVNGVYVGSVEPGGAFYRDVVRPKGSRSGRCQGCSHTSACGSSVSSQRAHRIKGAARKFAIDYHALRRHWRN